MQPLSQPMRGDPMTIKKKAVITLADMPEGTVATISGNPFPQFKGLMPLAHQHGLETITCDLVMYENGQAVVKAQITGSRGHFEAHGDACPENVPRGAQHEVIRRAETRAFSRGLRLYLGIGDCAADELSPDADGPASSGATRTAGQGSNRSQASKADQRASQPAQAGSQRSGAGNGSHKCPACGADVWDNRATAQGKSPLWRCKNGGACPGGKGSLGWASWDADYFEKAVPSNDQQPEPEPQAEPQQEPPPMDEGPPPFDDSDIPF